MIKHVICGDTLTRKPVISAALSVSVVMLACVVGSMVAGLGVLAIVVVSAVVLPNGSRVTVSVPKLSSSALGMAL